VEPQFFWHIIPSTERFIVIVVIFFVFVWMVFFLKCFRLYIELFFVGKYLVIIYAVTVMSINCELSRYYFMLTLIKVCTYHKQRAERPVSWLLVCCSRIVIRSRSSTAAEKIFSRTVSTKSHVTSEAFELIAALCDLDIKLSNLSYCNHTGLKHI